MGNFSFCCYPIRSDLVREGFATGFNECRMVGNKEMDKGVGEEAAFAATNVT